MEKAFTKPYENGWDAKPASNSWVTPEIMDNYDNAIDEIDNRVIGQIEDLTQFIDDGFLPKNKWKTNPLNLSASVGVNFDNPLKQGTYIIKTFDASTSGVFNFFGVTPSGNEAILSGASWADANNGIVFTTTKDYESLRFFSSANFSGNVQIEEGTEATPYTPYAPSNIELKENLTPNGYISSGLTYTNCSYVNGGYCKIGNLVVINMRVTATNPTFNVSGFPSYSGFIPVNSVALNVFDASSNSTTSQPIGMVEASGKITVVKATNNYIYFLSATYIAN